MNAWGWVAFVGGFVLLTVLFIAGEISARNHPDDPDAELDLDDGWSLH